MNFRKNMSDEVEVNLTPLIDVVFLLLIFFMVTTTFDKDASIRVNLPSSENSTVETLNKPLEVIIDENGTFFVDGNEVINKKDETLFRAMNQALAGYEESSPPLIISADAGTDYQSVVTVMDIARKLELVSISMSTSQAKK